MVYADAWAHPSRMRPSWCFACGSRPQDLFSILGGAVKTPDEQLAIRLNSLRDNPLPKLCEVCFLLEKAWQQRRLVDAEGIEYCNRSAYAKALMPSICIAFGKTWKTDGSRSAEKSLSRHATYHCLCQDLLPDTPANSYQLAALQPLYDEQSPVCGAQRKQLACAAWAEAQNDALCPSARMVKRAVASVMKANGEKAWCLSCHLTL